MIKKTLLTALLPLLLLSSQAQQQASEAAAAELKKLAAFYQQAPHLSFDAIFYIAAENAPGKYIDSLQASFRLSGKRSWSRMDSTETITGDTCSIILFKEDNIMYISKSSSMTGMGNPLALLDSVLALQHVKASLQQRKNEKQLKLSFPSGGSYKDITYYIDEQTGWLTKMEALIKASQLYDPSAKQYLTNDETYALMEVHYLHYSKARFDEHIFDTNRYFKKEGGQYVPTSPFKNYQIFSATPNF